MESKAIKFQTRMSLGNSWVAVDKTLPGHPFLHLQKRENNKYLQGSFENYTVQGFPGGAVVENLPANARDTGSSPGLGRSHMPRSS